MWIAIALIVLIVLIAYVALALLAARELERGKEKRAEEYREIYRR